MTKNSTMSNLNVSTISTNSQNCDYSRIGFERTASIHFDDLKSEQGNIRAKVTEVRKSFLNLRSREKAWVKRKEAMAKEMDEKEKKRKGRLGGIISMDELGRLHRRGDVDRNRDD